MLSVLWIWPLSLLARACSSAVFPAVEQSVTGQQGDTPKGRKENSPPHPPDSQTQGVTTLLLAELSAVPLMVPSHGDSHRPHMQG